MFNCFSREKGNHQTRPPHGDTRLTNSPVGDYVLRGLFPLRPLSSTSAFHSFFDLRELARHTGDPWSIPHFSPCIIAKQRRRLMCTLAAIFACPRLTPTPSTRESSGLRNRDRRKTREALCRHQAKLLLPRARAASNTPPGFESAVPKSPEPPLVANGVDLE